MMMEMEMSTGTSSAGPMRDASWIDKDTNRTNSFTSFNSFYVIQIIVPRYQVCKCLKKLFASNSRIYTASELRDQLLSVRSSEYLIQKLETAFKRSKDESGKLTLTEYLDVMFTDLPPNFM